MTRKKYKSYAELLRNPTEEDFDSYRKKIGVGICEKCSLIKGESVEAIVYGVTSQTLYHWDGEGEDPNRDLILCYGCSKDYTLWMWSDWADYYCGRI